jgi:hypothetical protein
MKDDKKKIENVTADHPQGKYETRDANFKPLMLIGLGLVVLVIVVLAATVLISSFLTRHSENPGAPSNIIVSTAPSFPTPSLEADPVLELKKFREQEDSVLSSYGWSDRQAGLVRVPIDKAINLLLKRGLPVEKEEEKK